MVELNAVSRLVAANGRWDDTTEISFKITGEAQFSVPRMLKILAFLGSAGASRSIIIEDVPGDSEGLWEGGDMTFGFDGDGADKITDLMVDGKPYEWKE